ncbi:plant UBX domain-containing protein 7-like protein [Tanacetum coccineum]
MTVSKLSSFGEIKAVVILHPGPLSDDDINDTSKEEQKRQGVWDAAQGGSTSATEYSNKNLASLYHPPFALMFNGPFEKAKEAANRQDRWLLVNVQSTKEFNSHMLNRDTWGNEAVAQTITSNFIFWQIYDDTEEGSKISTYYRLDSEEVPVTIVIDPITGQKMRLWRGMIDPESLLEVDNFVKIYPGVTHGWTVRYKHDDEHVVKYPFFDGTPQTSDRFTQHGFDRRMRKLKMPLFDGQDAYGWIYKQGDPVEQFLSINQAGTTRVYVALFEKLVGISKEVMEATFIKGLKSNLRATLRVMKMEGLSHAMELAISIEDNQRVGVGVDTQVGVDENDSEEEEEEASRDEDDHIHLDIVEVSLNYVLGFTPPPTMKLREYIHAVDVVVLANCGATYNFIAQRLLDQLGLEDTRSKIVGVILGNVKVEKSQGICKRVLVTFPKMQINEDFFPFELGTHRVMIQGDPSLCKTMVSFKSLIRSLRHEQEGIMIEMKRLENVPAPILIITTEIQALLDEYEDVFCLPRGLPPRRDHEHAIVLQNGQENKVANALSRRVETASCLALSIPHFQNCAALIKGLKHDPELEKIRQKVISGVEGFEEYIVEDDCLLYKGILVLPRTSSCIP